MNYPASSDAESTGHMSDLLSSFKTMIDTSQAAAAANSGSAPQPSVSSTAAAAEAAAAVESVQGGDTAASAIPVSGDLQYASQTSLPLPAAPQKTCGGTPLYAAAQPIPVNPFSSSSSSGSSVQPGPAATQMAVAALSPPVPFYKNPNVLIVGFVLLVIIGVAGYFLYKKFFAKNNQPPVGAYAQPTYYEPPSHQQNQQQQQPMQLPAPVPAPPPPAAPSSSQSGGAMSWPEPLPPTSVQAAPKRGQELPRPAPSVAGPPQMSGGPPPPEVEEEENDPNATKLSDIAF